MANPNPSPGTRFGAENGNQSGAGKTKKQKQAEMRAAEIAAMLREKMLSEMLEKVEGGENEAVEALSLLSGDALKLFKDSEDRAHGTPKATTEMSGPDGGDIPHKITVGFD
jgi:hypothetical protein